jgi:aspartate 1-decarboxylase
MGAPGDLIIAITYAQMDAAEAKDFRPTVVLVDGDNHIVDVTRVGHVPEGDADC